MTSCRASVALALGAAILAAAQLRAQSPLARAIEFEQQGRWSDAAEAYQAILAASPADAAGLFGAERVYAQLGRRDSTVAIARRALAADSTSRPARLVLLRTLQALHADTALQGAFERWVASAPRDPAPWREMARLLTSAGRDAEARAVILRARTRLGDPGVAAAELALVEVRAAEVVPGAEEWRRAVTREPEMLEAAVTSLRTVLPMDRDGVLRALTSGADPGAGHAIAAELLLAWESPRRAWAMLRAGLPAAGRARDDALRHFATEAALAEDAESQRAAAEALELLSSDVTGAEVAGLRIASARAFAAAGDGGSARRLLTAIAADRDTPGDMRAAASATLVDLAASEGAAEDAARLLDQVRSSLPPSDYRRLARRVAFAWLRAGALDRARAAVDGDSSLAGEEVRGWVTLYQGDVRNGAAILRAVGADAGDPNLATERAAVVALAAAVGRDSLPSLGAALFEAARGDTLAASRALAAVARTLPPGTGDEVRLWSARFAAAAHDTAAAEATWEEVARRPEASPAAAVSLLALARVAAARGRFADAAERLEALILRNPDSALVPEARRELERVRGLVPRS